MPICSLFWVKSSSQAEKQFPINFIEAWKMLYHWNTWDSVPFSQDWWKGENSKCFRFEPIKQSIKSALSEANTERTVTSSFFKLQNHARYEPGIAWLQLQSPSSDYCWKSINFVLHDFEQTIAAVSVLTIAKASSQAILFDLMRARLTSTIH